MYQLCDDSARQSDRHLLLCSAISRECPQISQNGTANYDDIFSNDVTKQLKVTQLYDSIFKAKMRLELPST